jgi:hypothetical protein
MTDFLNNCAIRQRTADGVSVGRCWHWLTDGRCPLHGDVRVAMSRYKLHGELTDEREIHPVRQAQDQDQEGR